MTISIITPLFAITKNPTPFQIYPFFSTPEEKKRKRKKKPECHNRGGKEEQRKRKKKLQHHSREISPFFSSSFLNIRRKEQPKKTRTHTIMP